MCPQNNKSPWHDKIGNRAQLGGIETSVLDNGPARGLHGRIGNIGATVEAIVQPDLAAGKLDMSITATTSQSRVFGPSLELKRTISGRFGGPTITVKDVVTNRANTPALHMLLYHCNFGWPLVDHGTNLIWRGQCKPRGTDADKAIFNSANNYRKCAKPLATHRGFGEACGFIDVTPDAKGLCAVGLHNPKLNLGLTLTYKKKQFPWLTNWQHFAPGEYGTALEPGTNPPIGQNRCRQEKSLIILQPGRCRTYQTEIAIKKQIDTFAKSRS